eukprot:scaffold2067_cov238-Pinguiococcus_pyrenoidosus.AAC.1
MVPAAPSQRWRGSSASDFPLAQEGGTIVALPQRRQARSSPRPRSSPGSHARESREVPRSGPPRCTRRHPQQGRRRRSRPERLAAFGASSPPDPCLNARREVQCPRIEAARGAQSDELAFFAGELDVPGAKRAWADLDVRHLAGVTEHGLDVFVEGGDGADVNLSLVFRVVGIHREHLLVQHDHEQQLRGVSLDHEGDARLVLIAAELRGFHSRPQAGIDTQHLLASSHEDRRGIRRDGHVFAKPLPVPLLIAALPRRAHVDPRDDVEVQIPSGDGKEHLILGREGQARELFVREQIGAPDFRADVGGDGVDDASGTKDDQVLLGHQQHIGTLQIGAAVILPCDASVAGANGAEGPDAGCEVQSGFILRELDALLHSDAGRFEALLPQQLSRGRVHCVDRAAERVAGVQPRAVRHHQRRLEVPGRRLASAERPARPAERHGHRVVAGQHKKRVAGIVRRVLDESHVGKGAWLAAGLRPLAPPSRDQGAADGHEDGHDPCSRHGARGEPALARCRSEQTPTAAGPMTTVYGGAFPESRHRIPAVEQRRGLPVSSVCAMAVAGWTRRQRWTGRVELSRR